MGPIQVLFNCDSILIFCCHTHSLIMSSCPSRDSIWGPDLATLLPYTLFFFSGLFYSFDIDVYNQNCNLYIEFTLFLG